MTSNKFDAQTTRYTDGKLRYHGKKCEDRLTILKGQINSIMIEKGLNKIDIDEILSENDSSCGTHVQILVLYLYIVFPSH